MALGGPSSHRGLFFFSCFLLSVGQRHVGNRAPFPPWPVGWVPVSMLLIVIMAVVINNAFGYDLIKSDNRAKSLMSAVLRGYWGSRFIPS
jgi:hypothetical protein